jgi:nicotinate-nucleotide adenylyltransferase
LIRKVGILGGTFDPVHYGHLALADAAGKFCDLDEILLLPAALPPHKRHREIASFTDRVAMLDRAIEGHPNLSVSTIEEHLPVPSFTLNTLQYLKLHSPADMQLYFICGADTFLDILSWKNYIRILQECHFAVFSRVGKSSKKLIKFIEQLGFQQQTKKYWENPLSRKKIFHTNMTLPDISSSGIKEKLNAEKSVESLVPLGVIKYIKDNLLYSS